jgi:acetyltransferase-like isoleucine patch superfamily enzyme
MQGIRSWLKLIFYRIYYHQKHVSFGENVVLDSRNKFDGLNVVGASSIIGSSKVGLGTYIADSSVIKKTVIGKFCSIGSYVQTGLGTHPAGGFVSTHPAFFSVQKQAGFTFVQHNGFAEHKFIDSEDRYVIEIGNDVWIGNNVIILDGLRIGDGAIVAAGSVVTKDVLPYAVVAGVPAKQLRLRFTQHQVMKLLEIKWWDWKLEKIKEKSALFNDIETFLSAT